MAASPGPNDDEASGGCNRGEEAETNPETPQNASGVDSIGGEEAVTRFAKKQNAPGGRGGEEAETRSTTGGNAAPGGNGEEEVGQWKEKTLSLEKTVAVLQARVQELERAVEKERKERAAERTGRIRAEQQLRSRLLAPAAAEPESPVRAHGALAAELPEEGGAHGDARDGGHSDGHGDGNSVSESDARDQSEGCDVAVTQHGRQSTGEQHGQEEHGHGSVGLTTYPMTPIGVIRSCFSARNGTPRQPLLVPAARAYLELPRGGVAPAALQGLEGYSHCWLLYVFHANTDIQRLWSDPHYRKFRAKVRVPRLQGGKLGALATRTPHRPVPIGLSIAKVERVEGRRVFLSGADLVDGTPMLDIKPYLPYSDALPSATVPRWVEPSGEGDGMHMASVTFHSAVSTQLQDAWSSQVHLVVRLFLLSRFFSFSFPSPPSPLLSRSFSPPSPPSLPLILSPFPPSLPLILSPFPPSLPLILSPFPPSLPLILSPFPTSPVPKLCLPSPPSRATVRYTHTLMSCRSCAGKC
ncbi:unnamed protein product [Closterium sp. NIES-64]|nr:unnamed protein product [Closterium sp. NIES-64]